MIRFVASFPKSGNTWIRLFLNAYLTGDKFDIARAPKEFCQDIDRKWYAKLAVSEDMRDDEIVCMRLGALLRMSHAGMVVKTHCANRSIDYIPVIPPSLVESAIYAVRDPRDVAVSFADHLGKPVDHAIDRMGDERGTVYFDDVPIMRQFIGSWSDNVRSWVYERDFPVLVVKYEDMIGRPVQVFRDIVRAAGYELDTKRLHSALVATKFDNLRKAEDERGYVGRSAKQERFFRKGIVGDWRDTLTDAQASRIEADHGEMMAKFGYLAGEEHACQDELEHEKVGG